MKSKTIKKTSDPEWKENWMVNVPENVSHFTVECWSYDSFLSKELLGSSRIDLDCIKGGEEHFMVLKLDRGEIHCFFQFNEL